MNSEQLGLNLVFYEEEVRESPKKSKKKKATTRSKGTRLAQPLLEGGQLSLQFNEGGESKDHPKERSRLEIINDYLVQLQNKTIELKDIDEEYRTLSVCLEAIRSNPLAIQEIENPSEDLQREAVRQDPAIIEYIKQPFLSIQLEAVRSRGRLLEHIENPERRVCFEAVKNDGKALGFVPFPKARQEGWLEEVCLIALQQYGTLYAVIKPFLSTAELEMMAFGEMPSAHELTKLPSFLKAELMDATAMNPMDRMDSFLRSVPAVGYHDLVQHLTKHPEDIFAVPNRLKTYRLMRLGVRLEKDNWCFSPYHQLEGLVRLNYESFADEGDNLNSDENE